MSLVDPRPRLRYLATNESLLAIRHGLAIESGDGVLSIAAAGGTQVIVLNAVSYNREPAIQSGD